MFAFEKNYFGASIVNFFFFSASTGFGGGFGASTSFGGATSAFKPAGSFGTTAGGFGSTPAPSGGMQGGMFGSTAAAPNQGFSFGGAATSTPGGAFGTTTTTGTASGFGGFGQQQQLQQVNGTTVKFNPPTGSDTMMKSGVQQNINTRHQVNFCQPTHHV